jgi:CPA2 family monovalent cation:H+ antiporter-2
MNQVKLNPAQAASQACTHTDQAKTVSYAKRECPECVAKGDSWVHLRICMSCGHLGCCDSSKNRHARAHFEKSGHPIIKSIQPGEDWAWCYLDDGYLE